VLVPRHPNRGPEIAALLRDAGLTVARRRLAEPVAPGTDIYVADTLGEMGLFYRAASIVFVGGSLIEHGGHNPIEPAQLDCALLWGPSMFNFQDAAAAMIKAGGAAVVPDAKELAAEVGKRLADPAACATMAAAAKAAAAAEADALDRIAAALDALLSDLGKT
jgi:3-deoxy-D-manno-octulosonic-acid transferase